MKKALIVGDGPTRTLVIDDLSNLSQEYDIYSIHYPVKGAKAVLSLDITQFQKKEVLALEQNIRLILSENCCSSLIKSDLIEKGAEFVPCKNMSGNSGAFAIEWCIEQGYDCIVLAGIDFRYENNDKNYIEPKTLEHINNYIRSVNCVQQKVYKLSSFSLVDCSVLCTEF